jgi:hypothetical protein
MDGVERPKHLRQERTGKVQDPVVNAHEVNSGEHSPTGIERGVSCGQQGAQNLCSRQSARDKRASSSKMLSEGVRFRLPDGQLHDGRGVQVGD